MPYGYAEPQYWAVTKINVIIVKRSASAIIVAAIGTVQNARLQNRLFGWRIHRKGLWTQSIYELNEICLLDSKSFYSALFASAWNTLQTFGYTHYGVESGALAMLHTWDQKLGLHPHIHCLVPAAGLTLDGKFKRITKKGKYLHNVKMMSKVFRDNMLKRLKKQLHKKEQLSTYQPVIDKAWAKPWGVFSEPSFSDAQHVIKYLGQYTHRVAISKRFQGSQESKANNIYGS